MSAANEQSERCLRERVERSGRAQNPLTRIVNKAVAGKEIAGIPEGDIGVINRAGTWKDASRESDQDDAQDKQRMSTDAHETIIASHKTTSKGKGVRSWLPLACLCAVIASLWKLFLLSQDAFPLNADEAVVGLMARHILAGDFPIFFYGQAYMGSLDALLVAGMFNLSGTQAASIRYVQIMLYAATIITVAGLAWKYTGSCRSVLVAGLLMAIPAVNTTLYTTVSLGGYGEALLLGSLQLHNSFDAAREGLKPWRLLLWALLTGFGVWVFGLTLVFSLAAGVSLLQCWHRMSENRPGGVWLPAILLTGMVGASPWLIAGLQEGFPVLFQELLGSAIAGADGTGFRAAVVQRLVNVLLFGPTVLLGFRPPWSASPLAVWILPFALAFWALIATRLIRRRGSVATPTTSGTDLGWVVAFTFIGLVLTPFGGDPSGRYFLPLIIPLVLAASMAMAAREQGVQAVMFPGLLTITLVFHVLSTLEVASRFPGITTQFDPVTWIDRSFDEELKTFLEEEDLAVGYSNYWVAYPLAFQSNETLIYLPWLPYHQDFRYTNRDDRYEPYRDVVEQADRFAYITTNHPALDTLLERQFDQAEVDYRVELIGHYRVYFNLSPGARPWQLELPWLDMDP